jgi:hypothetical protein
MWGFIKVTFGTNARQHLLKHLGFDGEAIATAVNQFTEKAAQNGVRPPPPATEGGKPAEAAVECCFRLEI